MASTDIAHADVAAFHQSGIRQSVTQDERNFHPEVTETEIAEFCRCHYGFEIAGMQRMEGYNMNFKIFVKALYASDDQREMSHQAYVLKILDSCESSRPEIIGAQLNVMTVVRKEGINAPEVVSNIKGLNMTYLNLQTKAGQRLNFLVCVFKFIDGILLKDLPIRSDTVVQTGLFTGHLDSILQNIMPGPLGEYDTIWRLTQVPLLWSKAKNKNIIPQTVEKHCQEILVLFQETVLSSMERLSRGIIHGDIHPSNIIVSNTNNDGYTNIECDAILDFGDCSESFYIFEVAMAIARISVINRALSLEETSYFFLKGYLKKFCLSSFDLDCLSISVYAARVQLNLAVLLSIEDAVDQLYLPRFIQWDDVMTWSALKLSGMQKAVDSART